MPNAKRKVYTMPRLRQQNKGADQATYTNIVKHANSHISQAA